MTDKEFFKLKKWNFGKKPISGSIALYSEYIKYMDNPSEYQIDQAQKGRDLHIYPDENGFKINRDCLECKTRSFTQIPSQRISVYYRHIKTVRLSTYN